MTKELENISKWLPFSDREVGIFQHVLLNDFTEYIKEEHTKEECFVLGMLATDFQLRMRCVRAQITDVVHESEKQRNKAFITLVYKYEGLVDFIVEKMVKYFNSLNYENQYNYKRDDSYSYFNLTEDQKEAIMKDVELLEE